MSWQDWQSLGPAVTGAVALCGAMLTLTVWVLRRLIREEIHLSISDELAPMRHDIEVLRLAVFNHLAHGERPAEREIRRTLGYADRLAGPAQLPDAPAAGRLLGRLRQSAAGDSSARAASKPPRTGSEK